MPVNKDALRRYRIIDRMLADPNRDYTTEEIAKAVNKECESVSIRMIQKDLLAIKEDFNKELVRNAGGRGTVKYADQSTPLFYQELTLDEEEVLREALKSLGQFDGLDNFTWLELLKKKLELKDEANSRPLISFSKNEGLQIPANLLGRLFTAISRRQTIRITYTKFGTTPKKYVVYPYQLKQFNERWFLLCSPASNEEYPFNPEFIATFPLDRMEEKFEYLDDVPFLDTIVDLEARFEEIIGVTLMQQNEVEDIYFAVRPEMVPYIKTKWMHTSQIELDEASSELFRRKYPSLSDCSFFSIECRKNIELYNRFASHMHNVILLEPKSMRDEISAYISKAAANYLSIK